MIVTGVRQRDAWQQRELPPVERIRTDVWSIPVPYTRGTVRYTIAYLLRGADGSCVVVDPGPDTDEAFAALVRGVADAGFGLDTVVGVLATHYHTDHLGLAERLRRRTGAWIALHEADAAFLAAVSDRAAYHRVQRDWLLRCGAPPDGVEAAAATPEHLRELVRLATPTRILGDGDTVPLPGRPLRVIATPGHTSGHICVADPDNELVLTGDHVLPRIAPSVAVNPDVVDREVLRDYYRSLRCVASWDGFEAAPAHEYRFRGLAARAAELRDRHNERSREVVELLERHGPATVWQLAARLTWSRGWAGLRGVHLRSAVSSTYSHVRYLAGLGRVTAEVRLTGQDAMWVGPGSARPALLE